MTSAPSFTSIRRERIYTAVTVTLGILLPAILVILAWRDALTDADNEARVRFEFRASEIRNAVSGRLLDYEQVLRGTAGLFAASVSVERLEWHDYYNSLKLEAYYPGIQAIGYAPRVTHAAKEGFIAGARAAGQPGYAIQPPGVRAEYFPILYIEPFSGRNLRAAGFDMNSDPVRSAAINEALASGRAAISGKIRLAQETDTNIQAGFLMYLPIYGNGKATGTAEQRRQEAQGVVYAAFRVGNLISRILGDERLVDIAVYDGTQPTEEALLYRTMQADASPVRPRYTHVAQVLINGHPWTLHMSSTLAFEATMERDKPRLVLLGGFTLYLLLLVVLWSLWTMRNRAVSLARVMTREVSHREAEWQAMSDASPLGIFRAGADGGYVYANPRYELLSGITAANAAGEGWLAAVHPEDRARVRNDWQAAVRGQAAGTTGTYRFLHPGGTVIWVTATVAVIREDGGINGYVGNIEDVTERKKATEALLKSHERLGMALEGSNLALFDWDIVSGEVRLSEQWRLMRGGDKIETVTTIEELQRQVHPDDLLRLQQSLLPVLRGNARFYEIQHRVRSIHGDWRWILSRAKVSERDAAGKALRLVGTNADITAGKEIERLKNEFISTVSHELRTPLTAIIGSLSLIRENSSNLDADAVTFLDMAYQNSERLAALINDVLDLETIESGQRTLDLLPLQLREVLEKAVRINQPYADIHQVQLRLLPGLAFTVAADSERLMQVLTNLISNAAKFSPAGGEVEISAEQRGTAVRVAVRDHGPGIPENFRSVIFQRFERADNSDTRKKGGTGLGLSICKALVEHMNGEIGFDSEAGKGSTFYFELPAAGGGATPNPA